MVLKAHEQGSSLVVEVQDTGPGIPQNQQSRLFSAYYRGESDRQRFSGLGLGLGLALRKMLVELHGGKIWAKSDEGKGSIFGFSIPLATAQASGNTL